MRSSAALSCQTRAFLARLLTCREQRLLQEVQCDFPRFSNAASHFGIFWPGRLLCCSSQKRIQRDHDIASEYTKRRLGDGEPSPKSEPKQKPKPKPKRSFASNTGNRVHGGSFPFFPLSACQLESSDFRRDPRVTDRDVQCCTMSSPDSIRSIRNGHRFERFVSLGVRLAVRTTEKASHGKSVL